MFAVFSFILYSARIAEFLGSLLAQKVKNLSAMLKTRVRSLGWEDPLKKEMATHSSILAWRIPWTEEPVGLQSMDCKELDTTEQITLSLFRRTEDKW